MSKINCIIVHGCPSDKERAIDPAQRTYNKHWIQWTKKELELRGIQTETPSMPNPWSPDYKTFKAELEKCIISENTILIGHSCGCAFLVRWLGDSKQKIKQLILVAPWKIPDEEDEIENKFYVYKIDEIISRRVEKIIIYTADNEEEDGKKSAQIFHHALGGEVVELSGRGHYTLDDMGTEEFPELIDEIIKE
jgi:hypothetical protein